MIYIHIYIYIYLYIPIPVYLPMHMLRLLVDPHPWAQGRRIALKDGVLAAGGGGLYSPGKRIRRFPEMGVPQNGWFVMETPIKWMIWGMVYYLVGGWNTPPKIWFRQLRWNSQWNNENSAPTHHPGRDPPSYPRGKFVKSLGPKRSQNIGLDTETIHCPIVQLHSNESTQLTISRV